MDNLINEFKKLNTPRRADLLTNLIYVDKKLTKTNNSGNDPSAIQIENNIGNIAKEELNQNQTTSTISNTPNHLPYQFSDSELSVNNGKEF